MRHDVICMICGLPVHDVELPNEYSIEQIQAATRNIGAHGDYELHGNETQPCWKTLQERREAEAQAEQEAQEDAERLRILALLGGD